MLASTGLPNISLEKATCQAPTFSGDIPPGGRGDEYDITFPSLDKDGMAVSQHVHAGKIATARESSKCAAGFLLNNEMTDFNTMPGVTDRKRNHWDGMRI